MRLASRLLPCAVLTLLAACGSDGNATLADLPGLRLSVQTWDASDVEPTTGFVVVSYDEEAFMASHGGRCARLGDDLGGALDGGALDPSSYGSDDEEFGGCYFAHLYFDRRFADDAGSVLTVGDDSLTVRATFAPGTFAPHRPTLRAPDAWRLRGGQEVRVGWSHPADLAEAPLDDAVYFHIGERGTPGPNGDNYFPLVARAEGDELRFRMPSPPPLTGPGLIVFRFGYTVGSAQTCTGATACEYSASRSFSHSVEIAR